MAGGGVHASEAGNDESRPCDASSHKAGLGIAGIQRANDQRKNKICLPFSDGLDTPIGRAFHGTVDRMRTDAPSSHRSLSSSGTKIEIQKPDKA